MYIKGCATEDYSDVLGAAGYIEEEPLLPVVSYMPPMCDLDYYSIHACLLAKAFHFPPNIRAAHWFATSGDEDSARTYFLRLRIAEQFLPQFTDNKYRSCFTF